MVEVSGEIRCRTRAAVRQARAGPHAVL